MLQMMKGMKLDITIKLIMLCFLEFAVWGAYLTSMGIYLFSVGLGDKIGWFFAMQGVASIFMPAIMGVVADRWMPAQKLLALCHFVSALFLAAAGLMGFVKGGNVEFADLFVPYMFSVAFFMPTIALTNSVSYAVLAGEQRDPEKVFPRIRVFGTVGFIVSMWLVDLLGMKASPAQFLMASFWGVLMALYSLGMPDCPPRRVKSGRTLKSLLGFDTFRCIVDRKMALFFLFSMLLGCALQVSNGYAGAYLSSFATDVRYVGTFTVKYPVIMTSLSQISETVCILLIPFFLTRFGIKKVMLTAMAAWSLRFLLLGVGNPGNGVWLLVLSMMVYGIAFDFFNISGSLYVNRCVDKDMRSSAQGLFMLVTNGLGASIGMVVAQKVVDFSLAHSGWSMAWYIFSAYAAVIAVLFFFSFKEENNVN